MNKTRHQTIDGCENFKAPELKSEYKSVYHWKKNSPKDFYNAYRNGLLGKICETFGWVKPIKRVQKYPHGYWTKERCVKEAKKYKTKGEWQNGNSSSYQKAHRGGWFGECTEHMILKEKPKGYWNNKNNCFLAAKKCTNKTTFRIEFSGGYMASKRNEWLEEFEVRLWPLNNELIKKWNLQYNKNKK